MAWMQRFQMVWPAGRKDVQLFLKTACLLA
jgi:hypothetical protein